MKSVAVAISALEERDFDVHQLARAGETAGAAFAGAVVGRRMRAILRQRMRSLRSIFTGLEGHPATRQDRQWLVENGRLIATTVKDVRQLMEAAGRLPAVNQPTGRDLRVCRLAALFLHQVEWRYDEERCAVFLEGALRTSDLRLDEIWAVRTALQLCLLERLVVVVTTGEGELPAVINSLRTLAQGQWKTLFARLNPVDPVLAQDPAGAYDDMEEESRETYRRVVTELASGSKVAERDVAAAAVFLAQTFAAQGATGRAAERRCHVGYYLVDDGLSLLRRRIGYRFTVRERLVGAVLAHPTAFYLTSTGMVTAALVGAAAYAIGWSAYAAIVAVLMVLPATQAAIELVNMLVSNLVPPRPLPKLDLSDGVPDACATLVAVPALLIDERHVRELVMDMEIRYLGNRDPNVMFALVTNARDSRERPREGEDVLRLAERLVNELNARYGVDGRTPFYLLHRYRAYNPSEGRWIGWERKRGKLLDLNQLLRGARDRFPVKVGSMTALRRARFVIVLDSDTELPRDAARRLIGTIAHPLNRAVVHPATNTVTEGYGILQPRVSVSTGSAARSWLASLYSGETGFDIYTRAVSDVYQDLFGEGIFTGKGIYEIDVFRQVLERRFPSNTLLSHDLIEGLFARAGLVSDIEVVDDYPSHFSAYSRRRHRWMRGDWQILRWLWNRIPDGQGQAVVNPLSAIDRWKILDNLRRTLIAPAMVVLLLTVWFVLPVPLSWSAAAAAMLLAASYGNLLLSATRAPWWTSAFLPWAAATLTGFWRAHVIVAVHLTYLLHDALLSLDAILRALVRMFLTGRRLLEWETAAEASRQSRGSTDVYLRWSPFGAAALLALLTIVRPGALAAAAPVLLPWMAARAVAGWLNRPRPQTAGAFEGDEVTFLRGHALKTWTYFATFSHGGNNWLIPDSVSADGVAEERVSPTNVAMLLNARLAAVHLGYLTVPEFVVQTRRTLATLQRLPRYRGHFLNWYNGETLGIMAPRFVSTVDSGNLATALWSLKQAARALAVAPPPDDVLWDGITDVARLLGADPDPGAQALCERVLRTQPHWRQSLRELEALALGHAASVGDDAGDIAIELLTRIRHARIWCETNASPPLVAALNAIATTAHDLVEAMDFRFLYHSRRKVLSIGADVTTGRVEESAYDLLASEARLAAFVAIAKGDVPQESWAHLGRAQVRTQDERVLLSWTGTLFEYLMPALWVRHLPRTLMYDSMRAAVAAQRKYAERRGIPWGFSESQFVNGDGTGIGYGPCGMPELALKPVDAATVVVSPYSSWLALLVDSRSALANLRRLEAAGGVGTHGFFEAIDYSQGAPALVKTWMAHHQGMSLLAAAELLCDHPLQNAFHAEPQVRATERLLEERLPRTVVPDQPQAPCVVWPEESAA